MDNEKQAQTSDTTITNPSNGAGRPSSITPEVVLKLLAVFQRGLSVTTALNYAKISKTAFYERYKNDEVFRDKIDEAKDYGKHLAGSIIIDALSNANKNFQLKVKTAQWYLERKEPDEYGRKPEIEVNNNTNNQYLFVSDEEFRRRAEGAGVSKINPATIAKALEAEHVGSSMESTPTVEVDKT